MPKGYWTYMKLYETEPNKWKAKHSEKSQHQLQHIQRIVHEPTLLKLDTTTGHDTHSECTNADKTAQQSMAIQRAR